MAAFEFSLADVPSDPELWLQHASGFILFEDVRNYALERLDPALGPETRALVVKAVNDALYGLMMVIDGVSGVLRREEIKVELSVTARLLRGDEVTAELDLRDGDGMCMGYHGWLEGDFGTDPIAIPRDP
ncbi:MAG: hypothetical protein M3313_12270 [Actinomycetota bacterium]|nr:hypothetical protein [Actinomycetota bacterium]